ncbi:hypothetical protein ARMGADRAFT_1035690 [Armillaria gallica]|uniref:Uncharacterized protein n=1 Tax=Armillaria gallica TaxID=47427 RepID=A0A2H3DFI8_ARMGA|nr:hypothetical protein ARMGADRAFT_1035690 [Armillaria gallica]
MATPQSESSLITGYMAAKQSNDLDPDLWYKLHTEKSSQCSDISQFGITIERSLKSVANKDWDKGHPAQICIDSIGGGRNANKSTGQLETLMLHNGVEQRSLWQRFITDNYDHPNVQMIMGNNDTIEQFKKNLPQWKQAFANAVAISPLVLIMGQLLNMPIALQVRGRLFSMGKPKLILHIEETLWKYIVGIAWGSWTSEVGLSKFLAEVQLLVTRMQVFKAASKDRTNKGWVGYEGEDMWFKDSITFIHKNHVPRLEAKIGPETM